MNAQNQAKLRREIAAAGRAVVARNGYVSPVDALLAIGWLRPKKVEDWRRGRVPYLEWVVVASLPKISTAMRIFEWPLAKDGRRHVHTQIDSADLPGTAPDPTPGPAIHTRADETDELFTRALTARRTAEADLAWLTATWDDASVSATTR